MAEPAAADPKPPAETPPPKPDADPLADLVVAAPLGGTRAGGGGADTGGKVAPTAASEDPLAGFMRVLNAHPIVKAGAEGAALSGAASLAGRGLMAAAPLTGPAAPVVAGAGAALSAAPVANALLGAAGGAGGQAVREYGRPVLGKATEPAAALVELGTPLGAQKFGRTVYEALLGTPSKVAQELAPAARKAGFVLEPGQVRSDRNMASIAGGDHEVAKHNQLTANRLASEETGFRTDSVDQKWIGQTLDRLGAQFGQIYARGNTFTIPPPQVKAVVEQMIDEMSLRSPAAVSSVIGTARALLGPADARMIQQMIDSGWNRQAIVNAFTRGQNGQPRTIDLDGEILQRLRMQLGRVAGNSSDAADRAAASELLETIDGAVTTSSPVLAAQLADLRPKYRAALTLQELGRRGGIKEGNVSLERLGDLLNSTDRRYSKGQSTNPLAELGRYGETFGLRSVGQNQEIDKELKYLVQVIKKYGIPITGAAAGGAMAHAAGMPEWMGAAGGLTAQHLAEMLRRGYFGQELQMMLARRMREPGAFPAAGVIGAELSDGQP